MHKFIEEKIILFLGLIYYPCLVIKYISKVALSDLHTIGALGPNDSEETMWRLENHGFPYAK